MPQGQCCRDGGNGTRQEDTRQLEGPQEQHVHRGQYGTDKVRVVCAHSLCAPILRLRRERFGYDS